MKTENKEMGRDSRELGYLGREQRMEGGGTERDEREWRDGRGAWEEKGRGNIAPTVTCEKTAPMYNIQIYQIISLLLRYMYKFISE